MKKNYIFASENLVFDTSKTKNKASYRCNGDLGPF